MIKRKRGRLVIVSAPSGCGKTTVLERLLKRNRQIKRSVSFTTRKPRPGERNGRDYFFVGEKEFFGKKRKGFFLEHARVFGAYYGTSKALVLKELCRGRDVVLAIDVQGMKQLVKCFAGVLPVVSIFMMPPSLAVLKKRLQRRRTENRAEMNRRLQMARTEMSKRSLYDYIVVNRSLEKTIREINKILKRA